MPEFVAPPHSGPIVLPGSMRRTAAGRWTVTGASGSGTTGSRLTAVAYCDTGPEPTTASHSVTVVGLAAGSATATCPTGKVLVAGGFNAGTSSKHQEIVRRLEASSPRQWTVTVLEHLAHGHDTHRGRVLLAGRDPVGALEAVDAAPAQGRYRSGGLSEGDFARVRRFARAFARGGRQGGGGRTLQLDRVASKTQWVVTGYNAGAAPGSLDALAYCR